MTYVTTLEEQKWLKLTSYTTLANTAKLNYILLRTITINVMVVADTFAANVIIHTRKRISANTATTRQQTEFLECLLDL
jgi:hypothetical protein